MDTFETAPAKEHNPWGEDYLNSVPEFKGDTAEASEETPPAPAETPEPPAEVAEPPAESTLPDALISNLDAALADAPLGVNDRPTLESINLQHQRDYAKAYQEDFDKIRKEHPELYPGEDGYLKYLDELLSLKRKSGESSLRIEQEIEYLEQLIDRLYHITGRADAKFETPPAPAPEKPAPEKPAPAPAEPAKPRRRRVSAEELLALSEPEPAKPRRRRVSAAELLTPPASARPHPRRRRVPTLDLPSTLTEPPETPPIEALAESLPEPERRPTKEWSKLQNDFLWRASTKFGGDLKAAYESLSDAEKHELEITGFLSVSEIVLNNNLKNVDAAVWRLVEAGPDTVPLAEENYSIPKEERERAKADWRKGFEANDTPPEVMDLLDYYVRQTAELFGSESEMYYRVVVALYADDGLLDHESDAFLRQVNAANIASDIEHDLAGQIQLDGSHGERFLIPGGHLPIELMLLDIGKDTPSSAPTPRRRRRYSADAATDSTISPATPSRRRYFPGAPDVNDPYQHKF